jgi:hypothetical protein
MTRTSISLVQVFHVRVRLNVVGRHRQSGRERSCCRQTQAHTGRQAGRQKERKKERKVIPTVLSPSFPYSYSHFAEPNSAFLGKGKSVHLLYIPPFHSCIAENNFSYGYHRDGNTRCGILRLLLHKVRCEVLHDKTCEILLPRNVKSCRSK